MTFRIVPDDPEPVSLDDYRSQAVPRWREARDHVLEANLIAAQLLTVLTSRSVGTGELALADRYVRDVQDHITRSASILAELRAQQRQLSTQLPTEPPTPDDCA